MKAFEIEGVDEKANTVVVELERSILAPIANLLQACQDNPNNNTHVAIRSLGGFLRNAAAVLYGEKSAAEFGFDVLPPANEDEDEDEVEDCRTGTGG